VAAVSDTISMVIGSGQACDLRVDDPYASPRHAAITRRPNGTYWIADLGSTNGTYIGPTFVGKARVYGPTPLRPGDIIWVGRTQIPWTPPA
jgi:pSer/pThr/pTyr-binding forkhead associated (FHA) protein